MPATNYDHWNQMTFSDDEDSEAIERAAAKVSAKSDALCPNGRAHGDDSRLEEATFALG